MTIYNQKEGIKRGIIIAKKHLENYFGILITLVVVIALLFSGSVKAVNLGISSLSNPEPTEQTEVSFRVYVDVVGAERIPIQNLTLSIGGQTCTFDENGTQITGNLCSTVSISRRAGVPLGYGYGFMYGYGYNSTGTYTNTTYNYGYGFANSSSYELDYDITWTTPDVQEDTYYTVSLDANAQQGSNKFTYTTTQTNYVKVKAWWRSNTGGGAGFSIPQPNPKVAHAWSSVLPEGSTIMKINNEDLAFTRLFFSVGTQLNNVEFIVEKYPDKPDDVLPPPTNVYQYVKIHKENLREEDIETARIRFKVENSWLSQQGLNPSEITLYKFYNKKWIDLSARELNSESGFTHYEAVAPSFSLFYIGNKDIYETSTPTGNVVEEQPTHDPTEDDYIDDSNDKPASKFTLPKLNFPFNPLLIAGVILVIITIIVILLLVFTKKPPSPKPFPMNKALPKIGQPPSTIGKPAIQRPLHEKPIPSMSMPVIDPLFKKPVSESSALQTPTTLGKIQTPYPELEEYISFCKMKGISTQDIKNKLLQSGWPETLIDEELSKGSY